MTVLRRTFVLAAQVWDRSLGRVLTALLVGLIRAYQVTLSPLTGPTCRYHPSCSAYALRAIREHGPIKGAALAGWRLLRCNPWSPGGIDFPPRRGEWHGIHEVQAPESGGTAGTDGARDVCQRSV